MNPISYINLGAGIIFILLFFWLSNNKSHSKNSISFKDFISAELEQYNFEFIKSEFAKGGPFPKFKIYFGPNIKNAPIKHQRHIRKVTFKTENGLQKEVWAEIYYDMILPASIRFKPELKSFKSLK